MNAGIRSNVLTTTESATTRDLSISVTDSEGGAVVCLSGRVSVDSSPDLRERRLFAPADNNVHPPAQTIGAWPARG